MSELLIELFSEEIPARMQDAAARDLVKKIQDGLTAANLPFGEAHFYYTPRRITAVFAGIPAEQAGYVEDIKGPRVSAPEQAIAGFLKKNGLKDVSQCAVRDGNGDPFYCIEIKHEGRKTVDTLGPVLTKAIGSMTWPKSMRWGNGTLRWARPLHTIIALYDGTVVPGTLKTGPDTEIVFGNKTRGHRFLGSKADFAVKSFADYKAKLRENFVVLDQQARRETIWAESQEAARKGGFSLKPDEKLLTEIVGLVEWPVPFMGSFPADYLSIPPEVISTTMRENQRYFTVLDAASALQNRFVCVANVTPDDGGKTIIYGNEKVLRARLSDARFFWEQDKKTKLDAWLERLKDIRFHEKLGSMYEKAQRLEKLSAFIAEKIGADTALTAHAAKLCKADLATGMVREFPELQGVMGGHYAKAGGEKDVVAAAISTHYSPAGPNDGIPTAPAAIAVALADKLDTIVGFFSIGEKPTGSKDPFALRRAALGIIRIVLENNLALSIEELLAKAASLYSTQTPADLSAFIRERFRVKMQGDGIDMKIVDAVLATGDDAGLTDTQTRILRLSAFLKTDKGTQLSALLKRTLNILKTADAAATPVNPALFAAPEEKDLHAALEAMQDGYKKAMAAKSYDTALTGLANLHGPIQAFFDKVMVMDEDKAVRANRITLIRRVLDLFSQYADFRIIAE